MTQTPPSTAPEVFQVGPPPPFDPELAPALARLSKMPPLTAEMIPAMRGARPAPPSIDDLRRGGAFAVEERSVPGPAGAPDVLLLICRPAAVEQPTAAVYYVHGGAMVLGDARSELGWVLDTAQELGLTVLSVEYRLAPETSHPGPVEDVYAGLAWAADHAEELGIDPARIVVAGGSAGGELAAAVALLARDRGGPRIAGSLLNSPMLDERNDSVSAFQMMGSPFDRTAGDTGWTALLGDARGGPDVSPYASPSLATDVSGLPPTFIDVGSAETLRDEDVQYATRLWQAGGEAELHVWQGACHGFDLFAPDARISQEARAARTGWLRRLLAR